MSTTSHIVVGLGFGDESKGTTVSALVRKHNAPLVVRFNGGAQAAHNVTSNGVSHTFRQFGSGTLDGAATFLSSRVLFNPIELYHEAKALEKLGVNPWNIISVDGDCTVNTPAHACLNQMQELTRDTRHGSCGLGIGVTEELKRKNKYVISWKDCNEYKTLKEKYKILCAYITAKCEALGESLGREFSEEERKILDKLSCEKEIDSFVEMTRWIYTKIKEGSSLRILEHDNVVFEGAQGLLIDEKYGVAPHHTFSDCTPQNAIDLLKHIGSSQYVVWGATRAYMTRHGAGYMPHEFTADQSQYFEDKENVENQWQGKMRYSPLNLRLLSMAIEACKVDYLAIHHLDQIEDFRKAQVYVPNLTVERTPLEDTFDYPESYNDFFNDFEDNWINKRYKIKSGRQYANFIEVFSFCELGMMGFGPKTEDKIFI